jgi:hypothetical protein
MESQESGATLINVGQRDERRRREKGKRNVAKEYICSDRARRVEASNRRAVKNIPTEGRLTRV